MARQGWAGRGMAGQGKEFGGTINRH